MKKSIIIALALFAATACCRGLGGPGGGCGAAGGCPMMKCACGEKCDCGKEGGCGCGGASCDMKKTSAAAN